MIVKNAQEIINAYGDKFANVDEILHPALISDPRFLRLLQRAVADNTQVTRDQIEEATGEAPWDEVEH